MDINDLMEEYFRMINEKDVETIIADIKIVVSKFGINVVAHTETALIQGGE